MKNIIILFVLTFNSYLYSQEMDEIELEDLITELFFEENEFNSGSERIDIIYTSVNFNSNTFYEGKEGEIRQFNLSPQISYLNSNGLSFSYSAVYLEEFENKWDLMSLSAGYSKYFGGNDKNFGVHGFYNKLFYAKSTENLYNDIISLSLSFNSSNDKLYISNSGNFYSGESNLFQLVSSFSYSFNLSKKRNFKNSLEDSGINKDYLKNNYQKFNFTPILNFYFNSETIEFDDSFVFFGSKNFLFNNKTAFGIVNTQLKLPIRYNLNYLEIEASYNLNFPNLSNSDSNNKINSYFSIALSYFFGI